MFTLEDAKSNFFDRKKVIDAVDAGKRQALSKAGAFVRQRAKSITGRRSSKSAKNGEAPKRHAGQLHDLIYFAYDDVHASTDVGPTPFGDGDAPNLLEFSGTATRRRYQKRTNRRTGKSFTAHYRGNPFMAPSLQAEIDAGTISSAWAGAVKG